MTMRQLESTVASLEAIRANLAALVMNVDVLIESLEPDSDDCAHKNSEEIGTMGDPFRRFCHDCKVEYQDPKGE